MTGPLDVILAQTTATDVISQVFFFLMFFGFAFLYPRLTLNQAIWKLESETKQLETMAVETRQIIERRIGRRSDNKLKDSIRGFMEFFAITPVDLDPNGIVKKLDMVVRQSDERFKWFVAQTAPGLNEIERSNIQNALAGAMMTHQIAKIVRHYLETIKKYKMFQMALVIQMQVPLIIRVAKAAAAATKAFIDGVPIGDGVGPLVIASFMPAKKKMKVYKEEEFAAAPVTIEGRNVTVCKATGPGAGTGYPGKFLLKFIKSNRIDRIISVDAALRLEGEKAGTVAEGVGVAMGGPGVDRYEMEEFAVKNKIPLDAVAVKVSDEEALGPMKPEILEGIEPAMDKVREMVKRARKNERILLMGVGNTCGIGDNLAAAKQAEELIKKTARAAKKENKKN
ncbi:MAG: DUF1512 family protein [Candidatus Aenigmatarchaeota archaeon]